MSKLLWFHSSAGVTPEVPHLLGLFLVSLLNACLFCSDCSPTPVQIPSFGVLKVIWSYLPIIKHYIILGSQQGRPWGLSAVIAHVTESLPLPRRGIPPAST